MGNVAVPKRKSLCKGKETLSPLYRRALLFLADMFLGFEGFGAADDFLKLDGVVLQEKLKEYVGHTPIQVAAGAILGILIAFILDPMFI